MLKRLKQRLFYSDSLNDDRQKEFDIARAIFVFLLPFIHITIECSTDEALEGGMPYLFDTILGGSFSAPLYMFVMGFGMVYSVLYAQRLGFKKRFQRGVNIFILGYVLNICRYLIPSLIGYAITGESEKYLEPLIYKTLGNDILTFAGLAIIIMSLLIKWKTPQWAMLLIGFGSSALGTLLNGIDVKNPLGNIFLGYLIGTEDAAGMVLSDFPVLNWILFPICGYVFATVLIRVKNKKLFYLMISPICAAFTVWYYIYGITNGIGMFGEGQNCYYHMTLWDAFASLTLTLALLGLYYFLSLILPEWLHKIAKNISQNITKVYFIHWLFVFVIADLVLYICRGSQILNDVQILLLSMSISLASIALANVVTAVQNKIKVKRSAGDEK